MSEIAATAKAMWKHVGATPEQMTQEATNPADVAAGRLASQIIYAFRMLASAEHDMTAAMHSLAIAVEREQGNLTSGQKVTGMWIAQHAERVAEAETKMQSWIDRIQSLSYIRKGASQ
jgi:uncharacterized lipoprotein YddW (UPF0748 family)